MPGYIERLSPDATMGQVFDDLYGRIEAEIEALDAQIGKTGYTPLVPGTALILGNSASRGIDDSRYQSKHVEVSRGGKGISLVSISNCQRNSSSQPHPFAVHGNRSKEISSDYRLKRLGIVTIDCELGKWGLWRSGITTDEPFGGFGAHESQVVSKLMLVDKQRLQIVAQGIIDNLTIIELLKEGGDVEDVFEAAGRH